jgi:broad specificity phosphatase PhoE
LAELFLVRHAQASFGSDDYDRLSELGHVQSRWLGEHFATRGITFDRTLTGTLRRHRETLEGMRAGGLQAPEADTHPGLDEYMAEELLASWLALTGANPPKAGADRREHFRMLREALAAWVAGTLPSPRHRSFIEFVEGARAALALARSDRSARRVLVVSSGGPIATLISSVLGTDLSAMVNLNLQMRNTGFSEFRFNERVVHCVSFNNIPHLDSVERRPSVTYS